MHLDPLSTAAMLLVATAAMAGALFVSARRQPLPLAPAQRIWATALACAPTGWLLLELAAPQGWPLLAVPGKALIMAAFLGHLHALLVLREAVLPAPWQQLPVVAVALASAGFYVLQPEQPMRTGLLSGLCALAAAGAAALAWREARTAGSAHARMVAIAFAVAAVLLAGRAALLFLPEGNIGRVWIDGPVGQSLLLGLAMLAPAVATLGFVLMGSDRLLDRLEALAAVDALTGTASRAAFLAEAGDLVQHARGERRSLALLVIDVDRFKQINDRHGHATGDRALALIGAALRAQVRSGDRVGRWGGEEFAMVLPDTDIDAALQLAQRLRQRVADLALRIDGQVLPLRVSIGATGLFGPDDTLQAMFLRADQAMYRAKREGRNQVQVWRPDPVQSGASQMSVA
jgi:diguanylate cyclase (GGDEF)-like protein